MGIRESLSYTIKMSQNKANLNRTTLIRPLVLAGLCIASSIWLFNEYSEAEENQKPAITASTSSPAHKQRYIISVVNSNAQKALANYKSYKSRPGTTDAVPPPFLDRSTPDSCYKGAIDILDWIQQSSSPLSPDAYKFISGELKAGWELSSFKGAYNPNGWFGLALDTSPTLGIDLRIRYYKSLKVENPWDKEAL